MANCCSIKYSKAFFSQEKPLRNRRSAQHQQLKQIKKSSIFGLYISFETKREPTTRYATRIEEKVRKRRKKDVKAYSPIACMMMVRCLG
jgi:hypothetical protein